MSGTENDLILADDTGKQDGPTEVRRQEVLLKTGALQTAILTSPNFSIIATDEKGIIQLFNVGAGAPDSTSCAKPRMALSGVRNSWLMLARKSVFA